MLWMPPVMIVLPPPSIVLRRSMSCMCLRLPADYCGPAIVSVLPAGSRFTTHRGVGLLNRARELDRVIANRFDARDARGALDRLPLRDIDIVGNGAVVIRGDEVEADILRRVAGPHAAGPEHPIVIAAPGSRVMVIEPSKVAELSA